MSGQSLGCVLAQTSQCLKTFCVCLGSVWAGTCLCLRGTLVALRSDLNGILAVFGLSLLSLAYQCLRGTSHPQRFHPVLAEPKRRTPSTPLGLGCRLWARNIKHQKHSTIENSGLKKKKTTAANFIPNKEKTTARKVLRFQGKLRCLP